MANPKPVLAITGGINVPAKVKKYLIGADIIWDDINPLSQNMNDSMDYYFNSKTTAMTDLLLRKYGVRDISQYINIPMHWGVNMDLVFDMPNRDKSHIDHHYFEFYGTIFPLTQKFLDERDNFYFLKNLEYLDIPDDNKNKKKYALTRFNAKVIGV